MKHAEQHATPARRGRATWPALIALGSGVISAPAAAIELGEIQVQSKLGQPLRASIAYALAPNEELARYCISVTAAPGSGLPTVAGTRVEIADGVIRLIGRSPVSEPMIAATVSIDCPYTPRIAREYLMFIDPPGLEMTQPAAAAPVARAATPAPAPASQVTARRSAPAAPSSDPVVQGSQYRVQPGESLSQIVQRIDDRQIGLWPAVNAVFDANPQAFLNNDPNRLKAGSLLVIPDFVGTEVARFAEPVAASPAAASTDAVAESTVAATDSAAELVEPVQVVEQAEALPPVEADVPVAELADDTAFIEPVPADTEAPAEVSDNPFVAATDETIIINETALEAPAVSDNPNRSVAVIQTEAQSGDTESGTSWLAPLAGGAAGALILWLLFGRRLRGRSGESPDAISIAPSQRPRFNAEENTIEVQEMSFDRGDDDPTEENLALDASLVMKRDLDADVDVDFADGFDATAQIDFELPAEENDQTDIIPPPKIEESSILASEVRPEDDDYDMSVIMDVTKVKPTADATEKDLQAIEIESKSSDETDGYTLNNEVDYDILAQDYQDELSATQALNMEIEKAAKELSDRLAAEEERDDATTNIEVGDMADLDLTAEARSVNDTMDDTRELKDLDSTDVNEALDPADFEKTALLDREDPSEVTSITAKLDTNEKTAEMIREDDTVQMPVDSDTVDMERQEATVEMAASDETAEMPAADLDLDLDMDDDDTVEVMTSDGDHTVEIITRDDDTVEMEIESGHVGKRKAQ